MKKIIYHTNSKRKRGYIALASVLVIATVVIIIGTSVALLSVSEIQTSLAEKKKEESIDFVEACVENALLRLNEENNIPTQIVLPQGTCSVTIDSQVDKDWTFTVSGAIDNYFKAIQVQAERESKITINSWREVE